MRRRRGFALVAALWFTVIVGAVVTVALEEAVIEIQGSANRSVTLQAEWARAACWAMALRDVSPRNPERPDLRARAAVDTLPKDSVVVSEGSWCRLRVADLGTRMNVNTASEEILRCLLGPRSSALIEMLPLTNDESLMGALGQSEDLRLFTTRGPGQLNVNSASERLLGCLPGWDGIVAAAVARARRTRNLESLPAVLAEVPLSARQRVDLRASELPTYLATQPPAFLVIVDGFAGHHPIQARMEVVVRRGGSRGWLVLSQEVE